LIGAMLLTLTSAAFARSTYLIEWEFFYPTSISDNLANCALCHLQVDDSGGYNPYGNAIRNQSQSLPLTTRFANVEDFDSDGDACAATNIEEINASTQPGWKIGDTLPSGLNLTDDQLDPTCNGGIPPVADPGGPYFGTEAVALTFDGSASSDEDGTVVSYAWDFGDGSSGTGVSPTHTYTNGGLYTVTLTVADNDGLSSDPVTTTADINIPPVADPNGPYSGLVGAEVTFDGTGSSDADGVIQSYAWDFGDGNTGTGSTPTNVYDAVGTYVVTLTVTDNDGASDIQTTSATIDILLPPVADAGGPYDGVENEPVTFNGGGSVDPDGTIVSYTWDFGDGSAPVTVATTLVDHTYTADGTYTATLTVTDDDGLTGSDTASVTIQVGNPPPVADAGGPYFGTVGVPLQLDGSNSSDSGSGFIVSYDWNYGDGVVELDAGATPTHTYLADGPYTVTLTVTDDGGKVDSDTAAANISPEPLPPVADAGGPYFGTATVDVLFDGSGSSDPDGNVVEWNWNFGDGTTGTGETPTHAYATEGTYDVTLTVVDNDGLTSEPAATTAEIGPADQLPIADPNGPYSGKEGQEVNFDGTGSYDPDGGIIESYAWNFGDGNTGIGPTPTNVYDIAGTYTVTLTVVDDEGQVSLAATTSAEIVPDEAPTALPGGPYEMQIDQQPVVFDGSASFDPDGSIVAWDWDFGDGNTDSGETVNHTYAEVGTYAVSLTVTDDFGNSDTGTTTATINPPEELPPVADANGPYSALVGETITFDGTGSTDPNGDETIVSFAWDFGDGSTGSGATVDHAYAAEGTYSVTLTVTDDTGLSDSDGTSATISPPVTEGDAFMVFVNAPNTPSAYVGNVLERIVRVYGDATITQDTTVTLTFDAPAGVTVQSLQESITAEAEPWRPATQYFFDVTLGCDAEGVYEITWTATIDAAANDNPNNDTMEDVTTLTCKTNIWR
jgi:PKD repeat protein